MSAGTKLATGITKFVQGGKCMLVLTRLLNESIVIGRGITVTVVAVKGDRVRIGINAPPDIEVNRQEVHERQVEFARKGEERQYLRPMENSPTHYERLTFKPAEFSTSLGGSS